MLLTANLPLEWRYEETVSGYSCNAWYMSR